MRVTVVGLGPGAGRDLTGRAREALERDYRKVSRFAKEEGLTAHANSIRVRFEDVDGPAEKREGRA